MTDNMWSFLLADPALILFGIVLPTADVGTDIKFMHYLYFDAEEYKQKNGTGYYENQNGTDVLFGSQNFDNTRIPYLDLNNDTIPAEYISVGYKSHPIWAISLLIPFLLNYFLSWLAWARTEKNKLKTFLWPTLNLYSQYRAAEIVSLNRTDRKKADQKKTEYEREVSLFEPFLESAPTALVMTIILIMSSGSEDGIAITGRPGSSNWVLFMVSWPISLYSASFGLAKCLKVGVCRILGDQGPLGGLVTPGFLMAFCAAFCGLFSKGVLLGHIAFQVTYLCSALLTMSA